MNKVSCLSAQVPSRNERMSVYLPTGGCNHPPSRVHINFRHAIRHYHYVSFADEKRRRNFNKFVEASQLRKREHHLLSGARERGFLVKAIFYLYIALTIRARNRNHKLFS